MKKIFIILFLVFGFVPSNISKTPRFWCIKNCHELAKKNDCIEKCKKFKVKEEELNCLKHCQLEGILDCVKFCRFKKLDVFKIK